MASVTLYKEIITRTGRTRGGLLAPLRSVRASLASVRTSVDGSPHHLRQTVPKTIELAPGAHEFIATGRGFSRGRETIEVGDRDLIVVISPDQTSVSAHNPLGSLRIHEVSGPEELQPYRFYKGQPTSFGMDTVTLSLWMSSVASAACCLVGVAAIGLAIWGYVARDVGVGVILSFFAVVIASVIPIGLGGLLTAIRFTRLPATWRQPGSQALPSHS